MQIADLRASAYCIPTDRPEADGTLGWTSTTIVVVEARDQGGHTGRGFTYGARAAAGVIDERLRDVVVGADVERVQSVWDAMVGCVRNVGRQGIAASAISAVDIALWDLRARAHEIPLYRLIGERRDRVPVYGSGGFTTYDESELVDQMTGWVDAGIPRVKMKIGLDDGRRPSEDLRRVAAVRRAIGPDAELFVDANGGYSARQAIDVARGLDESAVSYFEEPVSSDELSALAFVRNHVPMAVAAGEYGYDPWYFRSMLAAEAVDILQADATRCLGITGFLEAASIAHAFGVPLSGHTAPSLHAQVGCAVPAIEHVEYFHDHVRIEAMLFDGVPELVAGELQPDPGRPGLGLELKRADAERWRVAA
ncbi:MAG: mandelate racemase [Chloroflexi bacterium]|nr:mandelate racemase [Chloroflexota bacterium]